jgi:Domain of unknown function (DUF4351)
VDPETARLAGSFLPRFRFVLDDLTKLDESALRARPITTPVRLTVRLLRIVPAHAGDAGDAGDINDLRDVLRSPDGRELMTAILTYIEAASETPLHRLAWLAAQIGPEAEEVFVTTADMLRAEGRAQGHANGRAEGLAEGVGKGTARTLVRLLTRKFGTVPDGMRERIDAAPLEQLEAWSDRVLDAETLDEVFG